MGEWLTEQQVGTQTRIKQTIRLGIINGLTNQEIVKAVLGDGELSYRVDGPFSKARRHAEALVRTAAAHVTARADMAAFENTGIEKYRISSILDSRTTPVCAALDGKVYFVNDPKRKVPPFHANCRSTMIAIFDDDEPGIDQTFEQWLIDQPEDDQIQVLGVERHKLWLSGIAIDRFVDLDTAELIPLSELRKQLKAS
ncbi:minor capsid protein [Pseudomonas benzenivorans]|uniref:Minor capsid protein n=1 Tax=Pseudomonas benzenivorans TaxID=556533 RepID=A0ABZ0PQQ0_9PSED|nr:minor capsid protein [Pseudomonas benzenivorans]WPC03467.1 minor capsid protein [Pseudomonas benzenivorans]